jgi:hypothetical protein
MPTRNPALSTSVVGSVGLYYKDVDEALSYSVDVSSLLGENETVDIGSVVVTFDPSDPTIDVTVAPTAASIVIYIDVGGTNHMTYEFAIQFDSDLGNRYVDYFRMNVKDRVYKKC